MPNNPELAPGDTVQLKTGGPLMTLECFLPSGRGRGRCSWFDVAVSHTKTFAPEALVKAQ